MQLSAHSRKIWTLELTDNEFAVLYNFVMGKGIVDPADEVIFKQIVELFNTFE